MAAKLKKRAQRSQVFEQRDWDAGVKSEYVQKYVPFDPAIHGNREIGRKPQDESGGPSAEFGLGPEARSMYAETFKEPTKAAYNKNSDSHPRHASTLQLAPEGAPGYGPHTTTTYGSGVGKAKNMLPSDRAKSMKPTAQIPEDRMYGLGDQAQSVYKQTFLRPSTTAHAVRAKKTDIENEGMVRIPYGELAQSVHQRDYARPDDELYREARAKAGAGRNPKNAGGGFGDPAAHTYGLGTDGQSCYRSSFLRPITAAYANKEEKRVARDQIEHEDRPFGDAQSMYRASFVPPDAKNYSGAAAGGSPRSKKNNDGVGLASAATVGYGLGPEARSMYAETFKEPTKAAYNKNSDSHPRHASTLQLAPEGAPGYGPHTTTTYGSGVGKAKNMLPSDRAKSMKPTAQIPEDRMYGLGDQAQSVYKQTFLRPSTTAHAVRAKKTDIENEGMVRIPYGELAQSVHQRDYARPDDELYREARAKASSNKSGPNGAAGRNGVNNMSGNGGTFSGAKGDFMTTFRAAYIRPPPEAYARDPDDEEEETEVQKKISSAMQKAVARQK